MEPTMNRTTAAPTIGILALLVVPALIYGPIAQPDGYHQFADQRLLWGIPHGADVISNLGLVLVALYIGWIFIKAIISPESCPALVGDEGRPKDMNRRVVRVLVPASS